MKNVTDPQQYLSAVLKFFEINLPGPELLTQQYGISMLTLNTLFK